jgi:HAMP domain-containing protein
MEKLTYRQVKKRLEHELNMPIDLLNKGYPITEDEYKEIKKEFERKIDVWKANMALDQLPF